MGRPPSAPPELGREAGAAGPGTGGGRAWRIVLSLVLYCSVLCAQAALAEELPSDEELEAAFAAGIGGEPSARGALEVRRYGRTLLLSATRGPDPEQAPLELVCMLCTADEALREARTAGEALVGRDDGAGDTPPPRDMPEPESEPRPLWVPTLLVGLGLSAAAAGTSLLLLDGDCASTTVDAQGHCSQVHALGPAGWAALSVGAVSAVTGAVLFFLFAGDEPAGGAP